ncbi:DNA helicase/exodeoxyribonuclease V beta subunit [Rahnella sp. BIGb0236]|uniref:exodeoxyribonuclease V subunit beta n=1 Tax=Rahnella sp. BIGb0236 TaxID=2485117 RepID=UPI0010614B8F|nr:exodeoxyribonuclease V subunit beta [Rahnella sp. BIGb0236]TDS95651.1 DNA helicase/exodeoxyribonuclease V beta subunit [Rahnella sp. BIGb0236]
MTEQTLPSPLSVLNFPLTGSRLIEASAGTGKTFTIAALYVRLVLGHGGDNAFSRPLTPPEILVVTFTDAATKELRDRIRERLSTAAACFLEDPLAPSACDEFLQDLRAEYAPEQWPGCARKLQLAAEWMDESAVSTIHGWCNRMLGEHAFDSDSLFTQTLETDQTELLMNVVRDYWRSFYFPLSEAEIKTLRGWWRSPEDLHRSVMPLLEYADALGSDQTPADVCETVNNQKAAELAALKQDWPQWTQELRTMLEGAVAAKVVDGKKIQARFFNPWLEKLHTWATTDDVIPDLKTGWTRLTPAGLRECWKQGDPPEHPALTAMETLKARLESLPDARSGLLQHACRWIQHRFDAEQQKRAQMGFNDLLTRLDTALRSDNGARLAEIIRTQFPLAMIDEFQDTDPLQYRIFDAVYRVAENAPEQGLILIGDPKQAIYAFRGADIYTYLRARRDTGGRHYTLATNFRSTRAMVASVNQVFELAEKRRAGEGAFLFRRDDDNQVPFLPVEAKGRADTLVIDDAEAVAMTLWYPENQPDTLPKTQYVQLMAEGCATEIVRLLRLGQQGSAGFGLPGEPLKPVMPGDVAVLVNTGREAAAVRTALSKRGVRSVYLSDKESIFESAQAGELQYWLAACAAPENDRLLRAALATPSLNLSWEALDRLNQDENEWERYVQQFQAFRTCWRKQGILPMLRRLMWEFDVPRRLLGRGDERALTDLLHLSELLQQASVQLDGEHALIRYLAEQCQDEHQGGDARKLRLESDADLVKVVTVHKSKGLEYPLVFLPFACAFRAVKKQDSPLKWHTPEGELEVALSATDEQLVQADRERLGEDLRKFYVALTRSRYALWLGMAPLKEFEKSAPGYLFHGGETIEADALPASLQAMETENIRAWPLPLPDGALYRSEQTLPALGPRPPLRTHKGPRWWVTSFSGLQIAAAGTYIVAENLNREPLAEIESAAQDSYLEDQKIRDAGKEQPEGLPQPMTGENLYAFPRGPAPGNFLHGLLEWAGDEGFAALAADPAKIADQVARRCNTRGWEKWIVPLTGWLTALLTQPLGLPDGTTFTLAELPPYQVEMEFWFPLTQVPTRHLDRLVQQYTLEGAERAPLVAEDLNGMLKGFIDLVFEHNGRYYVLDYKSNWLGDDASGYDQNTMTQSMRDHRYDLQFTLYLFALHRLLKSRLPDYDYDRHIGGAVYLFLRGSHAPGNGVCVQRPDKALMEQLDALFSGSEAHV